MRRTDELITAIRTISRNAANPDGSYAISDAEIIQYMNDAQDRLQNKISTEKNIAKIFASEATISVVGNQEAYTIPDRVLLNKQIEFVEYSATGKTGDYIRMEKLHYFNRDTNTTTYPWGYVKRGGQILLQPTPSTAQGSIRVTYERELDDLDKTRGFVNAAPGVGSSDLDLNSTMYVSATAPGPSSIDEALFTTGAAVCLTYWDGTVRLRNAVVSSYNATTNVLTLGQPVSTYLVTGYTLSDLASCFLTVGPYTTVYSKLPDNCERYIVHYAAMELFHRDSSNDFQKESAVVAEIEADIVAALSAQTSELQFIPQMDRYTWW